MRLESRVQTTGVNLIHTLGTRTKSLPEITHETAFLLSPCECRL